MNDKSNALSLFRASCLWNLLLTALLLLILCPEALAHGTHSALMARVDAKLAEKPEDGGLWYQRAVLQFEHEDYPAAAVDFAKAEKFAPGQYAVYWWQGRILDVIGKPAEAKVELDRCLSQDPRHWGALASRARVYAKLGMNAESLADFRAALANCSEPQPDLIQEVAQALASNNNVDEAVAVLLQRIQTIGQIPSLQGKLLEIEVKAARYDAALGRLDAFEKSASRKEPWMEKRAIILAQAGRASEARAAWHTLSAHLKSLPPAERNSHAMALLQERTQQALLATQVSQPDSSSPFTNFPTHQKK